MEDAAERPAVARSRHDIRAALPEPLPAAATRPGRGTTYASQAPRPRSPSTDEQVSVRPHVPPTENAAAYVAWMDEQFGAAPLTLSSWARIVDRTAVFGASPGATRAGTSS